MPHPDEYSPDDDEQSIVTSLKDRLDVRARIDNGTRSLERDGDVFEEDLGRDQGLDSSDLMVV